VILNTEIGSLICLKPASMDSDFDKDLKIIDKTFTAQTLFDSLQQNPFSYFLFNPEIKYKFCKDLFIDLKNLVQKYFYT